MLAKASAFLSHAVPLLAALVLQPCIAMAEGAVRILDCEVTRRCDEAGVCEAAGERMAFRMEPGSLDQNGAGRYELSYDEVRTGMEALSYAGPFTWSTGTERHTLLANSETQFTWHRLALEPAPAATIRFLSCALEQ